MTLTGQQLNFLLDGFDLAKWRPHETLEPRFEREYREALACEFASLREQRKGRSAER